MLTGLPQSLVAVPAPVRWGSRTRGSWSARRLWCTTRSSRWGPAGPCAANTHAHACPVRKSTHPLPASNLKGRVVPLYLRPAAQERRVVGSDMWREGVDQARVSTQLAADLLAWLTLLNLPPRFPTPQELLGEARFYSITYRWVPVAVAPDFRVCTVVGGSAGIVNRIVRQEL